VRHNRFRGELSLDPYGRAFLVLESTRKDRVTESREVRNWSLFSRAAGAAALLVGSLTFVGWLLGIRAFMSVFPGLATMRPVAALCFALIGVSLWLIQLNSGEQGTHSRRIRPAQGLSGVVGLVGLLTLAEHLFHLNLGMDEILFRRALQATGILHPGRMAGATALGFLLLGASTLFTTTSKFYSAQIFALLTSLNGFIPCIGYLFGVRSLYNVAADSSMALHSALLFAVLGLATLAARPRLGLMATVTSKYLGGAMARRILPLVTVLPIFFALLRWRGDLAGFHSSQFGSAFLTVGEVVILCVVVWMSAVWLNQADDDCRESGRRNVHLAAVVESSNDAIFSKDMSGTIISWNQGAERLYGYSATEVIGKPVATIIPQELQEEATRFLPEIAEGRWVTREEIVRLRKDGSRIHVSLIISPMRDLGGAIVGASVIAHDITARNQAEESLREYERVVEGLEELIVVVDREYRYVIANRAFLKSRDMPRAQVIGHRVNEVVSNEVFETVIKEKMDECFLGKVVHYDLKYEFSEGGERDLHASYFPIEGSTGIDRIACVLQDITEARLSEEELRKSEERFSKAFRSSPLAITISTEEQGRYLDVNEAFLEMLGSQREDVIGLTAAELNFWAQPSSRVEMLRQLVESGRVTGFQAQYKTSKGEIRDADVSAELIELEGQACVLAIIRDITETRLLEAQFRQAQKMEAVGRLAGGVAHDFNNMLSVIIGYSDLSLGLVAPGNPLNEHLEQIRKASNRAAVITRQLLAFSRQQVVFPKILDLNEVVSNVTTMLQRVVNEDIAVSFRATTPIDSIKADPGQIEQVLMNLVVNARDAMRNGGEIVIQTGHAELDEHYAAHHPGSRAGHYVTLTVCDTGSGMDENTKSHVFEPFFTTKRIGQGTGLGLSTVYGIVKQTGGSIWVDSELGKGTTFKIYFPRVAAKAEHLEQPAEEAELPGGLEAILVVEDDQALRELTVRMLEGAGYSVMEAKNAERALEIVKDSERKIDLLLTDVIMPGKSGVELLEQTMLIRPNLRSLFMSGYTGDLIALRGVVVPEAAFLVKPFTRNSLLKKVRSALHVELATRQASSG
jgi:two-component system, cell cycle sensor histidine kinase and response regulator CckA